MSKLRYHYFGNDKFFTDRDAINGCSYAVQFPTHSVLSQIRHSFIEKLCRNWLKQGAVP